MQVDFATDGHTALNKLNAQHYDLLLADVRMPDMDGIELTQVLRQVAESPIKIIGVSAGALDEDRQACLDAGMNDHLSKPFKANDLLNKIQFQAFGHSTSP
jgi:CheY-like chemotaxis protein